MASRATLQLPNHRMLRVLSVATNHVPCVLRSFPFDHKRQNRFQVMCIHACTGREEMPSPEKFLQIHHLYAPASRIHALESTSSPPRKRKSNDRRSTGTSGLSPLSAKNGCLSPQQWKQWMHEAQELSISSSVFLASTSSESLAQAANEGLQLITNPVVAHKHERFASLLEERASAREEPTAKMLQMKQCTATDKQWRSPTGITKPRKRKKSSSIRIEPLLSDEMRTKLQSHLEEKTKGNIWENEIRSRLARPLSATTFCSRSEQLLHPLCRAQFIDTHSLESQGGGLEETITSEDSNRPKLPLLPRFPYSVEAHKAANCMRRCVLKAFFRVALKARARVVAIAIRVLRRRGIPLLVRGFRRRRRAAIRIQRQYRRFLRWRAEFLRPFVCKTVAGWVREGLAQVAARILIARSLTTLYQSRKARAAEAARRAKHLRRWVAKTRVSLFVHQIWTIRWFHGKRDFNVSGMKQELALLEASDHNVHLEYTAIFATPFGKDMLKKELVLWRVGARTRTTQEEKPNQASGEVEADADPAILRLRQCFQIFDLDGSGTLDLDEFQLMLSYLRGKTPKQPNRASITGKKASQQTPKLSTAQVRGLFAELDGDGNGGITCGEFERWWTIEHDRSTLSTSASTNFLSQGLDGLLLKSHGLLFWLLGRKLQLERKFVKKLMVRRAMESAKRDILYREIDRERVAGAFADVFRCGDCGRRFGLRRDLVDHVAHECNSTTLVVDTFTLKRWVHEEEFRLLEDVKSET